MSSAQPSNPVPATLTDRILRGLLFLIFVAGIFTLPMKPDIELDASWRMALAQFLHDGLQFGKDVVFTYGPLGFLMGKTYFGLYFWPLILWQVFVSIVFTVLIFEQGRDLKGYARIGYFAYFLLLGVIYDDALQMIMIALMGWRLIRHSGGPSRLTDILVTWLLAVLALVKFTNLMLAAFAVGVAVLHEFWLKRPIPALRLALWFGGAYLLGWVLCGQSLLNLPAYVLNSLEVSSGYQAAMGLPAPSAALWKGLVVLALLAAYVALYLKNNPDRPRALANVALLAAFVYLNWKHGFVRADGHMIGFFICAFVPAAAFPVLLGDAPAATRLSRALLFPVAVLCVLGTYDALPHVIRGVLGNMQEKIWSNIQQVSNWSAMRQMYRDRISTATASTDLIKSREIIGRHTVDVLGHDQAAALLSRLNYHPRPVFQGYSAYTPRLAKLNYDYYAGPNAPEYTLLRFQTIDGRLVTFDDSMLFPLLVHRYEYVHSEKGFQLWRRLPGPFDAAAFAPKPLRSQEITLNQSVSVEDLAQQPVWAAVDFQLSLLGKLRSFLYKPPLFYFSVEDMNGAKSTYRMPLPQGRTGFILNPLVEDVVSYMQFAGDKPERRIRKIVVHVEDGDAKYFTSTGRLELSSLKPSTAGLQFFAQAEQARFHVFKSFPIAYESHTKPSEGLIGGQPVIVMHAPSDMTFNAPPGAKQISGQFGLLENAYSNGGNSNGAEFIVYWTSGSERVELVRRFLDPARKPADVGLQPFTVDLPANTGGGRIHLQVLAGPYNDNSWDWTAWGAVEIK